MDGDRFWRMPECYIHGNTIKYLRVPDEVIDKVQEDTHKCSNWRPAGTGSHGHGYGREESGGRGGGKGGRSGGYPEDGTDKNSGRGSSQGGAHGGRSDTCGRDCCGIHSRACCKSNIPTGVHRKDGSYRSSPFRLQSHGGVLRTTFGCVLEETRPNSEEPPDSSFSKKGTAEK